MPPEMFARSIESYRELFPKFLFFYSCDCFQGKLRALSKHYETEMKLVVHVHMHARANYRLNLISCKDVIKKHRKRHAIPT